MVDIGIYSGCPRWPDKCWRQNLQTAPRPEIKWSGNCYEPSIAVRQELMKGSRGQRSTCGDAQPSPCRSHPCIARRSQTRGSKGDPVCICERLLREFIFTVGEMRKAAVEQHCEGAKCDHSSPSRPPVIKFNSPKWVRTVQPMHQPHVAVKLWHPPATGDALAASATKWS